MSATIIIPARYNSQRFPGKPLALILGKPMIQWVWEAATRATLADNVIIATDDHRILRVAQAFGATVQMTDAGHTCGTDRVAEIAKTLTSRVIINTQGDEPLIKAAHLDALIDYLETHPQRPMATLAYVGDPALTNDPDIVKVAVDDTGLAKTFSRKPIADLVGKPLFHIGIYGYQRTDLAVIAALTPTKREATEALEQLRVLDHGMTISVVTVHDWEGVGVDRPDDIQRVEKRLS